MLLSTHSAIQYAYEILISEHQCHTIILYGSHAQGRASDQSDIDMAGFNDAISSITQCANIHNGTYLDLFVLPSSILTHPQPHHLYMREGVMLKERNRLGQDFLAALEALYQQKRSPLSAQELTNRHLWAQKMYVRANQGDLEGLYRAHWLKVDILPDYFAVRQLWYEGSKTAFSWLENHDAITF